MIDEYIEKAHIAIVEGLKNVKKGKLERSTYYHVVQEYFDSIYDYVRENEDSMDDNTFARIHSLENMLSEFIVPFKTNLTAPNEVEDSDAYLLETIVYFTRRQLSVKDSVDFTSDSLRKYDEKANNYVKDMCDRLGLICYTINIADTFDVPKKHYITVVEVNERYYLIDSTYQQFFLLGQNFAHRYLKNASNTETCEVGARILGINKEGALKLLERGFISTDDDMFKDYFTTIYNQYNKKPMTSEEYLKTILDTKKDK